MRNCRLIKLGDRDYGIIAFIRNHGGSELQQWKVKNLNDYKNQNLVTFNSIRQTSRNLI